MYKKLLKNIRTKNIRKSEYFNSLYKGEGHPVKDRQPHFIFSTENPLYPSKIRMNHDEVIDFLQDRGYRVETIKGKYGNDETSILVHNPPKHSLKHLFNLAHNLGQESSIYSDGYNHEMHFHNGDNAGRHHKGQTTEFHKKPPMDYYSTLEDGTTFTHNFNLDDLHEPKESLIQQKPLPINKSEKSGRVYLSKSEKRHPLESAGPETKLVHYSRKVGLEELDPQFQGTGTKGEESKQGRPVHPTIHYYLDKTKPESLVTQESTAKYVINAGGLKLYDVGKDQDKLRARAKELAEEENSKSKYPNPPGTAFARREHLDQAIKDAGYHGIYNSNAGNMSNVVALYYKTKPEASYKIHANDHKEASTTDHHELDEQKEQAKTFAEENQHHNHEFLHNLNQELKKEDG